MLIFSGFVSVQNQDEYIAGPGVAGKLLCGSLLLDTCKSQLQRNGKDTETNGINHRKCIQEYTALARRLLCSENDKQLAEHPLFLSNTIVHFSTAVVYEVVYCSLLYIL